MDYYKPEIVNISWINTYAPPGCKVASDFLMTPCLYDGKVYHPDVKWASSKDGCLVVGVSSMSALNFGGQDHQDEKMDRAAWIAIVCEILRVHIQPIPVLIIDYVSFACIHNCKDVLNLCDVFFRQTLNAMARLPWFHPSSVMQSGLQLAIDPKSAIGQMRIRSVGSKGMQILQEYFVEGGDHAKMIECVWFWAANQDCKRSANQLLASFPNYHFSIQSRYAWLCVFSVRCPRQDWSDWFPKFAAMRSRRAERWQGWNHCIHVAWSMSELIKLGMDEDERSWFAGFFKRSPFYTCAADFAPFIPSSNTC